MWLPVAQRELIVASRKSATFWLRLVAPILAIVLFIIAGAANEPPARQGKSIFTSVTIALFLYCALAGLCFTAESITTERREGTLPLLQITGLRELDLVLGKLLGNSLPGIFGFLATTPLLALPLLLGGVTDFQFLRVALILLGTLLLSLSVSTYASGASQTTGQALKHSIQTMLVILGAGVFGYALFKRHRDPIDNDLRTADFALVLILMIVIWSAGFPTGSPAALLLNVFAPLGFFRTLLGVHSFWMEMLLLSAMILYFLLSARPFTFSLFEEMPVEPTHLHRLRTRFRRADPLTDRFRHTPADFMLTLGLGIVAGFLQFVASIPYYTGRGSEMIVLSWLSFGVVVVLYFILGRRAAAFLVESRGNGMIEVLLVTPLSWQELLALHRTAFLRLAWRPVLICMVGEIAGHLLALRFAGFFGRFEFPFLFVFATVLTYVCSVYATLWCAVLRALRSKSATNAAFWSVFVVLILPASVTFFLPPQSGNFIPHVYMLVMLASAVFIAADSIVWIGSRVYLNSLGAAAPAAILGLKDPSGNPQTPRADRISRRGAPREP
jgi:hypothetical protein